MNGLFGIPRIVMVLLVVVATSACAPAATTQTLTAVPTVPTATQSAIATATARTMPLPESTATLAQATVAATPTETPEETARYLLTFEATWSEETHPVDFPSNPHFSGLIGATHHEEVRLWEEGETATPGIQNMAETGGKSPLDSEVETLIAGGGACELISGGGIALSPGAAAVEFAANQGCPMVSVVSMIAPSPDWFVGVSGLSLYGDEGWTEEWVVELYPFDAGTDSGASYTSPNEPTELKERIYPIEAGSLLVEGRVPPLGVFRFTRLHD
jgi:hypothetical protein